MPRLVYTLCTLLILSSQFCLSFILRPVPFYQYTLSYQYFILSCLSSFLRLYILYAPVYHLNSTLSINTTMSCLSYGIRPLGSIFYYLSWLYSIIHPVFAPSYLLCPVISILYDPSCLSSIYCRLYAPF